MPNASIPAMIGKLPACAASDRARKKQFPLWMWWNLLSLDAPTVVCLWAAFFLQALHISIRFWEIAALSFAVWIVYIGDRMLDGLNKPGLATLSDRHRFYARHSRGILGALPSIVFATGWIGFLRLGDQTMWAGLIMCAIVFFYFFAIHGIPGHLNRWFPKELAVGGIFAAGAAIPAWIHGAGSRRILLPELLLFAGQCALNCIAIECWEHNRGERRWAKPPYWLIRWADARITKIAVILILGALLTGIFVSRNLNQADLLAATAISLLVIAAIDWRSNYFSPRALRVLADAAMLTPIIFLLRWMV